MEIGTGVVIGENCIISAHTFIPPCVTIGNDVFIGPGVVFTNDKYPPGPKDKWLSTFVEDGVSIGAGVVILPGVTIGRGSKIGAGSVVTHDITYSDWIYGNPANLTKKGVVDL